MKKLLFSFVIIALFISTAFSQDTNAYDKLIIQLLDEAFQQQSDLKTYLVDGKIVVQVDNKNVKIQEYKIGDISFVIGELSEIEKMKPYLKVQSISISKHRREGKLSGIKGEQFSIIIQTVDEQDEYIKKASKNELELFTDVLDFLFNERESEQLNDLEDLIQGNVLYVDLLNKYHLPDSISYKEYLIVFISPTALNIEKCANKYIQILDANVNRNDRYIELDYRLINANKISSINSKCAPCKNVF